MNDEANTVQGSGATFDEALKDAHDRAAASSTAEMKRSRVSDVSMTTGGVTGVRTVYVQVRVES